MVIELKPQIENKIQEFKASGKTAEAAGLQNVLDKFVENYGALKSQKAQENNQGAGKQTSEEENSSD